MIPRRFCWLFDLLVVVTAFIAARSLVPYVTPLLFAPNGLLRKPWLEPLTLPSVWSGALPPLEDSLWILLIVAPFTLVILGLSGNHGSLLNLSLTRITVGCLLSSLAGLSVIALALFTLKVPGWSRLLIFIFTLLNAVGLVTYRLVLREYFMARRAAGFYHKNVLLIGLPTSIEWMVQYFRENIPTQDYQPFGYLCVCPNQPCPNGNGNAASEFPEISSLGDVKDLGDLLIHQPIHEVIAVHPNSGGEWINKVIQDCDYFAMPLRIVPEALLLKEPKSLKMVYHSEPLHLPAVVLTPPHSWDSEALFFKRLLDVSVSATLLVLLSPLFALIALAIKLTTPDLPILYPWRVVGRNGVEFIGYKFTTMIRNADQIKRDLISYNEMTGPVFKMKDDPRV